MPGRVPLNFRGRAKAWAEFARRHAGNPFLDVDALDALPDELINAIVKEVPGFFSQDQQTFERDLAKLGRGAQDLGTKQTEHERQLHELLAEEMKRGGANQLQIDRYFEAEAERYQEIESRVEGYCGWLVTDPQFRSERDELRRKWGEHVEAWGGFPSQRHSYLGEPSWSAGPQPAQVVREPHWTEDQWVQEVTRVNAPFEPFWIFYNRWCLEQFVTWDLPQPLRPEFYGFTTHNTFVLSAAGVNLFLPWHLLRDRKFTLQNLAAHLKKINKPTHLEGWLTKGRDKLGLVGYRRLYVIYRYWHLAITTRYPERILGNTEALDRAFAAYMEVSNDSDMGAESIKKIRLKLAKRLSPPTRGK
jgi:hypothetical protein